MTTGEVRLRFRIRNILKGDRNFKLVFNFGKSKGGENRTKRSFYLFEESNFASFADANFTYESIWKTRTFISLPQLSIQKIKQKKCPPVRVNSRVKLSSGTGYTCLNYLYFFVFKAVKSMVHQAIAIQGIHTLPLVFSMFQDHIDPFKHLKSPNAVEITRLRDLVDYVNREIKDNEVFPTSSMKSTDFFAVRHTYKKKSPYFCPQCKCTSCEQNKNSPSGRQGYCTRCDYGNCSRQKKSYFAKKEKTNYSVNKIGIEVPSTTETEKDSDNEPEHDSDFDQNAQFNFDQFLNEDLNEINDLPASAFQDDEHLISGASLQLD